MPRRKDPSEARCHQIGVFVRTADLRVWRADAAKLNMSVSRYVYLRARRSSPTPVGNAAALVQAIGAIGRVGVVLNQLAKMAWTHGFDGVAFDDALAMTQELQRLLRGIRIHGRVG